MGYSVTFTSKAARDFRKLPKDIRDRIAPTIERLKDNPRPIGCEKVKGTDEWRVRVGDYRIRYRIDDAAKTITITRIGHRRDVYEG
jgi:mRNA interferase RelE/StbE